MSILEAITLPHWHPRKLYADELVSKVVSNGLAALVIKTATAGLSYGMFVTFANLTSRSEYGYFALGFSIAMIASTVAGLGLNTAVLRFLPEYLVNGRPDLARGVVVFSRNATVVGSAAALIALAGCQYVMQSAWQQTNFSYLLMAGVLVPGLALSEFLASVLRASGATLSALIPRDIFWRAAVPAFSLILAGAGLRLTGNSSLAIAAGLLALTTAGQALYAAWSLRRNLGEVVPAFSIRPWLSASWPMWGSAILFSTIQQFDVLVVGLFLSPEETGKYFAALKTASLLGLMLVAGNMISAPLIARYFHGNNREELARLCRLLAVCLTLPTLAGLLIVAVTGRWLLGWFDASYSDAYPLLLVLAAGFAFDAICGPTGYFQQMIGRERNYLGIVCATYLATLVAPCVFTPIAGVYGAAIPNVIGVIACNIWAITSLRREFQLDCSVFGLIWKPTSRKNLPDKT